MRRGMYPSRACRQRLYGVGGASAERTVIARGGGSRHQWALGLRERRQANRLGCADGIPW